MKKGKGCLIALVSFLVIIFGVMFLIRWAFSDHEFRYSSIEHWLFVDKEMDKLPLVGAKRTDVIYISEPSDGTKPPMTSMIYTTQSEPQKILSVYKAYYDKLGYTLLSSDGPLKDHLLFKGKGIYEDIEIYIIPARKFGNDVRVTYSVKL